MSDGTQFPEKWEGVTGSSPVALTGTIVDGHVGVSDFGEFEVVDVRREDGTVVAVPAYRSGLKKALKAAEERGELGLNKPITIELVKQVPISNGRSFFVYEVNGEDGGTGGGRKTAWAATAEESIPPTAALEDIPTLPDDEPVPFAHDEFPIGLEVWHGHENR